MKIPVRFNTGERLLVRQVLGVGVGKIIDQSLPRSG
jgi:hypothetical protein